MKFRNNILVATVSAIALLAAAPLSAADDKPTNVEKSTKQIAPGAPDSARQMKTDALKTDSMGTNAINEPAVGAIGSDWVPAEDIPSVKLVGSDVVNAQNEKIGEVESTTVVDGKSVLIVSVGEYLGMGSRTVAINQDQSSVFRNRSDAVTFRVAVDMTQEQLKMHPAYTHDAMDKTGMKKAH